MILISLIGQTSSDLLPIITQYKNNITNIVLIFDDTLKNGGIAQEYIDGLELYKKENNLTFGSQLFTIDEDKTTGLNQVHTIAEKLALEKHKDILLVMSDALATSSAWLGHTLLPLGIKLIAYNPLENEYNIVSTEGIENFPITASPTILDYLSFSGYTTDKKYTDATTILPKKDDLYTIYSNMDIFLPLRKKILHKELIEYPTDKEKVILKALENIKAIDSHQKMLDKKYLEGTTFEEYVFCIAHELGFDDMLCGVKVNYDPKDRLGDTPSNEFDVVCLKNNKLYVIECKMTKNYDPERIIYNLDATKNRLHALSKVMFVALHDERHDFSDAHKKRARTWDMDLFVKDEFTAEELQNKIREFIGA